MRVFSFFYLPGKTICPFFPHTPQSAEKITRRPPTFFFFELSDFFLFQIGINVPSPSASEVRHFSFSPRRALSPFSFFQMRVISLFFFPARYLLSFATPFVSVNYAPFIRILSSLSPPPTGKENGVSPFKKWNSRTGTSSSLLPRRPQNSPLFFLLGISVVDAPSDFQGCGFTLLSFFDKSAIPLRGL